MRTDPAWRLSNRILQKKAETDKAAMRAKLSEQLNSILGTRETPGLIVSMSEVLFDSGKTH
jgi:hypothetical protein